MSKDTEKMKPFIKKASWLDGFTWGEFLGVVILLSLVVFGPILLTLRGLQEFAFDQSSAYVGDTIGGTTAPFLNLISALLVYKAFRAQIKANEALKEQNTFSSLSLSVIESIKLLKEDLDNFEYVEHRGLKAISITIARIVAKKNKNDGLYPLKTNELVNFISRIYIISNLIDKSDIPKTPKSQLMTFVYNLYTHYFLPSYIRNKTVLLSGEITILPIKFGLYNKEIIAFIEKNTGLVLDIDNLMP